MGRGKAQQYALGGRREQGQCGNLVHGCDSQIGPVRRGALSLKIEIYPAGTQYTVLQVVCLEGYHPTVAGKRACRECQRRGKRASRALQQRCCKATRRPLQVRVFVIRCPLSRAQVTLTYRSASHSSVRPQSSAVHHAPVLDLFIVRPN